MWVNSLGLEEVYINNLYEDLKDGLVLLRVINKVKSKIVEWKKVEIISNHRIKKIHNCNLAVNYMKNMGFSLVGIGGIDIVDGNKKLILAFFWQLVKLNTLNVRGKYFSNPC